MSLYLEARAQLPLRAATLATAWCQSAPLFAVSIEGGHVWVVNEEVLFGVTSALDRAALGRASRDN